MSYDPHRHHRRSIRLAGWDYRTSAAYFVTICTHERECLFLDHSWCNIAETSWLKIPQTASRVVLDEWIVMPNHVHGILILTETGDAPVAPFNWRHAPPLPESGPRSFANAPAGSLGAIIRSYKAAVTRRINDLCHTRGHKRWQRGYYERIVRDQYELERIQTYIRENPSRWAEDHDNLDGLLERMVCHDC